MSFRSNARTFPCAFRAAHGGGAWEQGGPRLPIGFWSSVEAADAFAASGTVASTAPAAPTLAWSGTITDNTPDLTITFSAPQVSDVATVQLDTVNTFPTATSTTDTVDAGQVAANSVTLSLSTLADGTYYTRAKVTRSGVDSAWSNVVTLTIGTDTSPNAFTFTDITGATTSTIYTSNTITVSGIDAPTPISITGGTYSVNGGSYVSASGTVNNGDTVSVRTTSSASNSTAANVVLTIGGVSDTYTVTTTAGASGGINLLAKSNIFTDAAWSNSGTLDAGAFTNKSTSPTGFPSTRLVSTGYQGLTQNPSGAPSNGTKSFYARSLTGTSYGLTFNGVAITVTSTWQRFVVTNADNYFTFYADGANGQCDIEISSAQFEAATSVNGYTDVP